MSASEHKVGSAINVWQSQPDKIVGQSSTVKLLLDAPAETVREKHDALCDAIDVELATKAEVVNITEAQTINGIKTFVGSPIVPTPTTDMQGATKKYVDDSDGERKEYVDSLDEQNVKITGVQSISGVKTFTESPIIPAPTSALQPSTKKYVDDAMASAVLGNLPDDSITNAKLGIDIKVGSLALLDTTDKSNVVGAINEISDIVSTLSDDLETATQESCIVTVSTDNAQSVVGQTITLHNVTASTTTAYTLVTSETSHTFKIPQNQQYYITVDAKATYSTPAQTATFTALGANIRNVSMQYLAIKRYGYRRTKAESNSETRIVYQFDAVGITPAYMDFTSGNFNYGGWQTFINDVSRPVMLKTDGTVDYELSRTDMTKKTDGTTASDIANTAYDGNAMIEFRKYIWVQRYEDATYEYVTFCNTQYDSSYKSYATTNALGNVKDAFYWGACKGTNVSSKLRSIGTGTIMVSQTRNTEVSYATAIGSGYYTIYKSGWDFIGDLLTLISGSDNSQTKFGSGRSKSTNTTAISAGTMNALPYFKGYNDETSDVKVFGIEGFWGNVWEGIAGFVYNGNIKTKMIPSYNFDGTGYTDTGLDPSGTSGGFVNTASVTDASGYVPKTASGSGTTYYCDGLYFNNAQVDYALVGGGWVTALLIGCRFVNFNNLASNTDTTFGSRLSYINPA